MTDSPPRVSVVIPVFNDPLRLALCLDALERQSLPAEQLQVIVVDNGSRPELELPPRPYRLTLLRCPDPGSYAARNLALGHCEAEVVAFTDADCRPQPCWLEEGLASLERQAVDLLAGAVILEPSCADQPTAADLVEQSFSFRQERYVARGAYGATANLFVRQDVLVRLGGFDQRRKSGADRDFGERARSAGFLIGFASEAAVVHPARERHELLHKARRVMGGRLDGVGTHPLLRLRELLLHLRPLLRETVVVIRLPLAPRERLGMLVLLVHCRWAAVLEWLRLCFPHSTSLR